MLNDVYICSTKKQKEKPSVSLLITIDYKGFEIAN